VIAGVSQAWQYLFNVLKGNLSLVGPRPQALKAKAEDKLYSDVADGYLPALSEAACHRLGADQQLARRHRHGETNARNCDIASPDSNVD
jgi:hypothetical protein